MVPILTVSSATRTDLAGDDAQRQRDRIARERKALAQRAQEALRDERHAGASAQRMQAARVALHALAQEEYKAAHEALPAQDERADDHEPPNDRMLDGPEVQAREACVSREANAPASALPAHRSAAAFDDPAHAGAHAEFDLGWTEMDDWVVQAEERAVEACARAAGPVPDMAREMPEAASQQTQQPAHRGALQSQRYAQPVPPSAQAGPNATTWPGTPVALPDDIAVALERLHALTQVRSDHQGETQDPAAAHALDDRIEGTLAYLEGYMLDAATKKDTGESARAHAHVSKLLAAVRERLEAWHEKKRPAEDAALLSKEQGNAAASGVTTSLEAKPSPAAPSWQQPPAQQVPISTASTAQVSQAHVTQRLVQGTAAVSSHARRTLTSTMSTPASERTAPAAQSVKRLREALESDDPTSAQHAAIDERQSAVTLPQRVVQGV